MAVSCKSDRVPSRPASNIENIDRLRGYVIVKHPHCYGEFSAMTVKTSPLTSGVEIVKLFNLFQSRRAPIVADYDDCLGYYLLATERWDILTQNYSILNTKSLDVRLMNLSRALLWKLASGSLIKWKLSNPGVNRKIKPSILARGKKNDHGKTSATQRLPARIAVR